MVLLDLKFNKNIQIHRMICPQLEHLYIIKYLPVQKAFFPEISLDTHLSQFYVEDVITLHTQLELLRLAGQQTPRSHDHINST